MAWPFTPLTTYIANSVPAIKAFDLNELQAYVNALMGGTKSIKKLLVDGTGDNANGNANGSIVASGPITSSGSYVRAQTKLQSVQSQWTSVSPGTGVIAPGEGYFGMIPFAAGLVAYPGLGAGPCTLERSANIDTVDRTATVGEFDVTLLSGVNFVGGERLVPVVTPFSGAPIACRVDTGVGVPYNGTQFRLRFCDMAGANSDPAAFLLVVVGG